MDASFWVVLVCFGGPIWSAFGVHDGGDRLLKFVVLAPRVMFERFFGLGWSQGMLLGSI